MPTFTGSGAHAGVVIAPVFPTAGRFTRVAAVMIINVFATIKLVPRDRIYASSEQDGGWDIELALLFLLDGVTIALLGSGRYALSMGTAAGIERYRR